MRRILVIRLGALGDMVLSFPAFAALRAHHAGDHIALLTTAPFASLAADSPWFDEIRIDSRPDWLDPQGLWQLRRQLTGFDLIYDLQTSRRSGWYFRLAGRPPWSGIARSCALPDADPGRNGLHTVPRQRGQLAAAGVPAAPVALDWLRQRGPVLEPPYAVLVPGTSASQGGAKRWPLPRFAALAAMLEQAGLRPVIVGTRQEAACARLIKASCRDALDLVGATSIQELAGLLSRAALAVGGDTGPIHLAGMMGCRTLSLFSRFSDPVLAAPVGDVRLIQAPRLDEITAEAVMSRLRDWLPN